MNIFVLDKDPRIAAQSQCDKHVVKMVLESAQMLSTAHRVLDGDETKFGNVLYKVTHKNHPCNVWCRTTSSNYTWLYMHFIALCDEYRYRYGKIHLSDTKLRKILQHLPKNIHIGSLTEHPLAMKKHPECMDPTDIVGSYRKFYKTKLENFKMVWTKRETPNWFSYA